MCHERSQKSREEEAWAREGEEDAHLGQEMIPDRNVLVIRIFVSSFGGTLRSQVRGGRSLRAEAMQKCVYVLPLKAQKIGL